MKVKLFILLGLMLSTSMYGADGNHRDYSPKSPEAAAFDRVPDIPVSAYTGTFSFSLPIYTLTSGDIKVPITLEYQGNAIPVDQEATWVGLNWLLNAGGAITTRLSSTSVGMDGELIKDWEYMVNQLSMTSMHADGGEFPQLIYKMDGAHPGWRGGRGKNWFKRSLDTPESRRNGDLSQELYHYILNNQAGETPTYHAAFLGNSVSFVWDRLKDEFFIIGRNQNFKIIGTPASPTIIDGYGYKYSFDVEEVGNPEGYGIDPAFTMYDKTLYLSEIVSPTGQKVKFNYVSGGLVKTLYKISENLYENKFPLELLNGGFKCITNNVNNNIVREIGNYYTIKTKRLASIVSDNAIVKFNPSKDRRRDINGESYKLDNIEIFKKENKNLVLLKRFRFSYFYMDKNETGGNVIKDFFENSNLSKLYNDWFDTDDFMYLRLSLNSFWEEDIHNANNKINKYTFVYNASLPCKASAAIDYWGFYNGQENFNGTYHTLIPKRWESGTSDMESGIPAYLNYWGADRRPNAACTSGGMLTGIIYPTGGVTSIFYEPHQFSNYTYLKYGETSASWSFTPLSVYTTNQEYGRVLGAVEGERTFYLEHDGHYQLCLSLSMSNEPKKPSWKNILGRPLLLYHYGPIYTSNGYHGEGIVGCDVVYPNPNDTVGKTSSLEVSRTVKLKAGKYMLTIAGKKLTEEDFPQEFYRASGSISKVYMPFISNGAGVRVKSIVENDDKGTASETFYDYSYPNDKTSGLLMTPAILGRNKIAVYQNTSYQEGIYMPNAKEIRYATISGDNAVPNPTVVAYDRVTISKKGNGSRVYTYWNKTWGTGMLTYCRNVRDPRNGLVLTDSTFDASRRLIRTEFNSYKWKCVDSRLLSAVVENIYYGPNAVTGGNALASFNEYANALGGGCMQIYLYPSAQFSMLSSHHELADYNGNSKLAIQKDVWYNQVNGLDSLSKSVQSEGNDVVLEETYYPQDFRAKASAKSLVASHIISVPMEHLRSIANDEGIYVMADHRTDYDDCGNVVAEYSLNNKEVLLRNDFTLWKDDSMISSVFDNSTIISYNKFRKPRMVWINNSEVCTYIWGYSHQYPIATIKGANYEQVARVLNGNSAVDLLESAETPNISCKQLYALLSKLSGCLVTTYAFNPYVGMVEMIDSKGESRKYDYDSFARLNAIKDHDGIVFSAFKYNYKNK